MVLPLFLSFKEIWRNKLRFLLVSMVVALITFLVLFTAGLAEGLGGGNREYLENLDGELLLFQETAELNLQGSRLAWSKVREVLRIDGVAAAGPMGQSFVSIILPGEDPTDVNMWGVAPKAPGDPALLEGVGLLRTRANEVVVDESTAKNNDIKIGDVITIKAVQGVDEKLFELKVTGISESSKFFIQPSIFVPYETWDRVRPQPEAGARRGEVIFNVISIKLDDPTQIDAMTTVIERELSGVQAVTRKTAYEAAPGYSEQQRTLNTQQGFTLLIAVLVIGGFFQIQTLQKLGQVGMLKAIGAGNGLIVIAALLQIVLINTLGVLIGGLGTSGLALVLPEGIPIIFDGTTIRNAVIALFLIGPLGGLVTLRTLLKVEPLTALGLGG